MKKLLILCLLFPVMVSSLFSESLKIADAVLFKVPSGWSYVKPTKQALPEVGVVKGAVLEHSVEKQTLSVLVLSVDNPVAGMDYATALVDATVSPYVELYRKQGNHYYPRKLLWQGNYLMYSQPVGRLQNKKVELRGILIKNGNDYVNFFCIGPREISWSQYAEWINGTQLLNTAQQ